MRRPSPGLHIVPSTPRMLRAALGFMRRCPRCGSGGLFRRWFTIVDDCPRCGLHFEREPGYWAGALAINIGVTGAVFVVVFVIALVLTVPDVPVAPIIAILAPLMILTPIVYYPFSKTVWIAVDRALLQHLDPNERLDEQTRSYASGRRSTRRVSTPSVKSHVASPMIAKSWKSCCA